MSRWSKEHSHKRISLSKFKRVEAMLTAQGDTAKETFVNSDAIAVRFNLPFSITGWESESFFYFQHPETKVCYRMQLALDDEWGNLCFKGCWNETRRSRDWNIVRFDMYIHPVIYATGYRNLPSWNLNGLDQQTVYRAFLETKLVELTRRNPGYANRVRNALVGNWIRIQK